jgi:hypothetical protein
MSAPPRCFKPVWCVEQNTQSTSMLAKQQNNGCCDPCVYVCTLYGLNACIKAPAKLNHFSCFRVTYMPTYMHAQIKAHTLTHTFRSSNQRKTSQSSSRP